VYELATNAMKFGALSPRGGRLNVLWQIQQAPSPRLLVGWKESKVSELHANVVIDTIEDLPSQAFK
jgi:two-component system CheB/CheR fusion protein